MAVSCEHHTKVDHLAMYDKVDELVVAFHLYVTGMFNFEKMHKRQRVLSISWHMVYRYVHRGTGIIHTEVTLGQEKMKVVVKNIYDGVL